MASVNRIVLVGHVGAPAELRYRTSGVAVTLFRLATARLGPRETRGLVPDAADWHTVEVEGKLGVARNDAAVRASMLMRTGTEAYVEGSLAYRPKGPGPKSGLEAVVLATRVEVLSQPPELSASAGTDSEGSSRRLPGGKTSRREAGRGERE